MKVVDTLATFLFVISVAAFDCSTRKDGMYPSSENACTDVFWKCWVGNAFRYTCPSELYYRADAEYCDYKEKVPNCEKKSRNTEEEDLDFDCSDKPDGYHTRQQLFYCEKGKTTRKSASVNAR